tara:strand:- start:105 stop:596 length:492 start_codon:yes stop_codon:yes gene_type:complete
MIAIKISDRRIVRKGVIYGSHVNYSTFSTHTKEQICQHILKNMDYSTAKRLFDMYGFAADFSTFAPDSIRYPPSANIPMGLVNTPKLKEKMSVDNASLTPKLENFAEMYQQMAVSLLNMSLDKLIPPGHPMYSKEHSIKLLKDEKEKILKENLELKKKLENKK